MPRSLKNTVHTTHTMAVRKKKRKRLPSLGPGNRMLSRESEDKQNATYTHAVSLCARKSLNIAIHPSPIISASNCAHYSHPAAAAAAAAFSHSRHV